MENYKNHVTGALAQMPRKNLTVKINLKTKSEKKKNFINKCTAY